jgi:uncharacterized peroxidase-related enzyme
MDSTLLLLPATVNSHSQTEGEYPMNNYTVAPFERFNEDTAPEKSKEYLAKAKAAFGLVPNVEQVMAQAPALLASYMTAWDEFDTTTLTPAERQVVYQTTNFENNCQYCMPWHTMLAENAGLPKNDVEALRQSAPLSDPKHEALRIFTRDVVRTQGSIEPYVLKAFLSSGYTEQQALEVILGVAIKVMSNYTNSIAQTPLDPEAKSKAWVKPSLRA